MSVDIIEFAYGKDFKDKMDKLDIDLKAIDDRHKNELEEGDAVNLYYILNFSPLRLRWVKEGINDKIKNEIISAIDTYFSRK